MFIEETSGKSRSADAAGRANRVRALSCARARLAIAKRKRGRGRRYIPAAVRRAVWERDQGRCTFEGAAGRCGSSHLPQLHHILRHADGGPATVENLTVHCFHHNQYVEAPVQ